MHGDRALFERVTLEAFQSGLSWITILRKREGFRAAFSGFDPDVVAGYGPAGPDTAARRRGHRPQPREDRGRGRERAGDGRSPGGVSGWPRRPRLVVRAAAAAAASAPRRDPRGDAGVDGVGEGAEASWLRVRGPDDGLRDDAGRRPRRRPHRRLLRAGSSRVGPLSKGYVRGRDRLRTAQPATVRHKIRRRRPGQDRHARAGRGEGHRAVPGVEGARGGAALRHHVDHLPTAAVPP